MVFTGHVEGGKVVFPLPLPLPEGTQVKVEADGVPTPTPDLAPERRTIFLDHYRDVIGKVDLPTDAASQHDHYLYGSPKR